MTEVRTSSLCERPCAGIEETGEAPLDAGEMECSRRRKVHSLIDKVYDPANLAEAWKRVRENKGSAGIDGRTSPGSSNDRRNFWRGCTSSCERRPIGPHR
jgi:hypothetical protein